MENMDWTTILTNGGIASILGAFLWDERRRFMAVVNNLMTKHDEDTQELKDDVKELKTQVTEMRKDGK